VNSSLADRSLRDVLEAFASPAPTPGGGSAAALAGALGSALLVMVASLPKSRNGTSEERAILDEAKATLGGLRARLLALADRDAAAYDLVVAAFRLPKGTDDEKAARTAAVQEAFRVAAEVPLETLAACREAQVLANAVAQAAVASAASDVGVAMHQLGSAWMGAMLNIETNITSLKDPVLVEALTARVRAAVPSHERPDSPVMTSPVGELMKSAILRFVPQAPMPPRATNPS
jgi:methenyltetrahydrofolate cyclohydrolase